jgi:hypothetical protein
MWLVLLRQRRLEGGISGTFDFAYMISTSFDFLVAISLQHEMIPICFVRIRYRHVDWAV